MTGFSNRQLKRLNRPIDSAELFMREKDGKELSYVTAWYAIAEANAIFGHAGWDRQTLALERIFERTRFDVTSCGYMAHVRVTVRTQDNTVTREGTGFGQASAASTCDAHERALKSAETDATKRALATFGDRLGLSLYRLKRPQAIGKPQRDHLATGIQLIASDGSSLAQQLSPEGFAGGLRQLIENAPDAHSVNALMIHNASALSTLAEHFTNLTNRAGRHYSDILRQLAKDRTSAVAGAEIGPSGHDPDTASAAMSLHIADLAGQGPGTAVAEQIVASDDMASDIPNEIGAIPPPLPAPLPIHVPSPSRQAARFMVDKSLLSYSTERRIRSKQHLSHVAAKPCLVCEETPCHAHHLTFAQPRGLAVKVSDEFTVPLCAAHHNEVHQARPEKSWWQAQGIDSLGDAEKFWEETLRMLTS